MRANNITFQKRFFLLFLLLAGCALSRAEVPSTDSPSPILFSTPDLQPTATAKATPYPPLWLTPMPTRIPYEKLSILTDLYKNNAGCEFPCWWGIVPGETTWFEVLAMYESFASGWREYTSYYERDGIICYYMFFYIQVASGEIVQDIVRFEVREKDYVVDAIAFNMENSKIDMFKFPDVLALYGKPDEIVMYGAQRLATIITLYYEQLGFITSHYFFVEDGDLMDGEIKICPENQENVAALFWSPDQEMSLELATRIYGSGDLINYKHNVDEVTSLSPDEFYQVFSESPTQCIEVQDSVFDRND